MPSSSNSSLRISLLSKRANPRKISSSSVRSWVNVRLSLDGLSRSSSMIVQHETRCPHCHQPTKSLNSSSRSTSSNRRSHAVDENPKLSLQKALTTIPYTTARQNVLPPPVSRVPKPKFSVSPLKNPPILPGAVRVATKDFWKHKLSRVLPPRPVRPPLEQCPPEQEYFPRRRVNNAQRHSSLPIWVDKGPNFSLQSSHPDTPQQDRSISPATIDFVGDVNQVYNAHHDLTNNLLTGSASILGHNLDSIPLLDEPNAEEFDAVLGSPSISHQYSDRNSSLSTLLTTASKVALRPSPLRLTKEEHVQNKPPLPLRSPLRTSQTFNEPEEHRTLSAALSAERLYVETTSHLRTRASSYATMSVYSSDEDDRTTVRQPDTPPSSPPPIPFRSPGRGQPHSQSAEDHAEQLCEGLGILDDIYSMYHDSSKRQKHEAVTDDIEAEVEYLSELDRSNSTKMSRTQRRTARDRARRDAIQRLLGLNEFGHESARDTDFEQWLELASQHQRAHSSCSNKLPNIPEEGEGQSCRRSTSSKETVNGPDFRKDSTICLGPNNAKAKPSRPEVDSMVSLNDLRGRLLALMDGAVGSTPGNVEAVPPNSIKTVPAPTVFQPNTHGDPVGSGEEEGGLANLQRINIEWKGKEYPVLIGESGKLWEAPCTDPDCKQHGQSWDDVSYEMF